MPRTIQIAEFHLNVLARRGWNPAEYAALRRTLNDRRFQAALRRAVRDLLRRYPSLSRVRLRLSW